jgi:undecaprenyl-diphosphatase
VSQLTYAQTIITGFIQGVTELFPISSLGHNVLIPALIGGTWAKDLNVSAPDYLAFIVGLHVATALAMIIYFWRDWVRIIGGFLTSLRDRRVETPAQRLAWMIVIGTIPVGIVGLVAQHAFQEIFAKAVVAAWLLMANGVILYAAEKFRPRASKRADQQVLRERELAEQPDYAMVSTDQRIGGGRHASGHQAARRQEFSQAVQADVRLSRVGFLNALLIGGTQILALLAGISRDGVVMAGGMFRGLSRVDAARFSFLLSAPVILAAGVLKAKDLTGASAQGMHGQILVGSVVAGVSAYLTLRFLVRYLQTRTLYPFAIYCVLAGLGSAIYLTLK